METNEIKKYTKRLSTLATERSGFMAYWGELSDFHLSYRGRFLNTKSNVPKRNTKQVNNTSRMASRTLASGMMAGITSPARAWFKLTVSDDRLNEFTAVKQWLHAVEKVLYRIFSRSNTYNSLHSLYAELGVFGVGAMGVYPNFDNVIRCKTYTVGSYMLALDGEDRVDTFYREYQNSVSQLVKQFGIGSVSETVKNQWESGNSENMINCVHAIEPNDNRDRMSPFSNNKPVRSVYFETTTNGDKFLRKAGFDEFPIMAPRWDVVAEDIYSSDCPGMLSLGDTKALQLGEKRKYQAIDKIANPPLMGDSSLKVKTKGQVPNPGEIVYLNQQNGAKGLASIYGNFRPDINAIREVNEEAQKRIKRAFYEDLFLLMIESDRRQITAREVAEKQEEKLLMLGPVLERLHTELLDPLIDRVFNMAQRAGILPRPPRELLNTAISVEYVSVLAQAQRMVGISGLQRTVSFVAEMTQIWPEARHKLNILNVVDEYSDAMGVNPNTIRGDDEVSDIMQQEAAAAAAVAKQEQDEAKVNTAQTASTIDTSEDNALSDVMKQAGLA